MITQHPEINRRCVRHIPIHSTQLRRSKRHQMYQSHNR